MIKHPQVKLTRKEIKRLFIEFLQVQINYTGYSVDNKDLADALNFSDLTVEFVVQLLDKAHPVSVMERGFKNGK